jgi:hypothetical protein
MTDADRFKLLGKYHTPRFRYGQVVFCEVRGWVILTGLTLAPLPWPVCKKAGRSTGRTSLVVFRDLLRALRRESNQAVAHWWGVAVVTVSKWRKALGVKRGTEGSLRLMREYALEPEGYAARTKGVQAIATDPHRRAKIAAAMKGKPKPRHVIEAARQANLGRKASKATRRKMSGAQRRRQAAPVPRKPWGPWEDAMLGVVPDAEVARRTGRREEAVRSRRARLLIPVPRAGGWVMDRVIGRRLFTDGLERDVYEDAEGRQYVFDGDGERVYGVWLWPPDEPVITEAPSQFTRLHPLAGPDRGSWCSPKCKDLGKSGGFFTSARFEDTFGRRHPTRRLTRAA